MFVDLIFNLCNVEPMSLGWLGSAIWIIFCDAIMWAIKIIWVCLCENCIQSIVFFWTIYKALLQCNNLLSILIFELYRKMLYCHFPVVRSFLVVRHRQGKQFFWWFIQKLSPTGNYIFLTVTSRQGKNKTDRGNIFFTVCGLIGQ